jgi:hypothetical protein
MKRRILIILLLAVSGQLFAAENLKQGDYEGTWKSNYVAVKNEKQLLKIALDSVSVFERHFENSNSQVLNTETFELLDDLLVLTFTSPDNVFGYKFALSGWKSTSRKTLYGSMFMYRNGIQFNMLPVSFVATD